MLLHISRKLRSSWHQIVRVDRRLRRRVLLHISRKLRSSRAIWWSQAGSNRRPPACKAGALPAELWPQCLIFFSVAALHFLRAWSHTRVYAPGARKNCALLQKKSLRTTSTSYSFPALTSCRKVWLRFPLTHFCSNFIQIGSRFQHSVLVHVS